MSTHRCTLNQFLHEAGIWSKPGVWEPEALPASFDFKKYEDDTQKVVDAVGDEHRQGAVRLEIGLPTVDRRDEAGEREEPPRDHHG